MTNDVCAGGILILLFMVQHMKESAKLFLNQQKPLLSKGITGQIVMDVNFHD